MFLYPGRTYYRGTEQTAPRGWFLLLIQPKISKPVVRGDAVTMSLDIAASCAASNTYAIVRRVALRQFGHFMMGRANIGGRWAVVSGAYGSDGLPMDVDSLPCDAVPLPPELYNAWKHGGGWNSCGSEAHQFRAWAIATFAKQIGAPRRSRG